jgi:16S rRNA (uracil1498-N3)-methyltransferase
MNPLIASAAPRFYFDGPLSVGAEIELPARAAHHVAVLRLRTDDPVTLFNGSGGAFTCTLSRVAKDSTRARVMAWNEADGESTLEITLAQGLSSSDRMDLVLQKATELGVRAIQPFAAERSVVRLSDERADRRLAHWRNLVIASCEQCGRNRLPEVRPVSSLGEFLSAADAQAQRLLLSPAGTKRLRDLVPTAKVVVLIGPEGGLSENEENRALRSGFTAVGLGPRVLRTETAPIAAIAALQAMWGDG